MNPGAWWLHEFGEGISIAISLLISAASTITLSFVARHLAQHHVVSPAVAKAAYLVVASLAVLAIGSFGFLAVAQIVIPHYGHLYLSHGAEFGALLFHVPLGIAFVMVCFRFIRVA